MSSPSEQAQRIIARWRKVFLGLYLAFVAVACLVTLFSILAVHFGEQKPVPIKGRRISAKANKPKELRRCHRRLNLLLTDLHKETFGLLARAQRYEIRPATEWADWSRDWRHRWRAIDHRCRLSEIAGQGISPEIDKMARIHQSLDELHITYTGVVKDFAQRYAGRFRLLEQEVASVRAMIDRRRKSRVHRPQSPGATQ